MYVHLSPSPSALSCEGRAVAPSEQLSMVLGWAYGSGPGREYPKCTGPVPPAKTATTKMRTHSSARAQSSALEEWGMGTDGERQGDGPWRLTTSTGEHSKAEKMRSSPEYAKAQRTSEDGDRRQAKPATPFSTPFPGAYAIAARQRPSYSLHPGVGPANTLFSSLAARSLWSRRIPR